MRSESQVSSFCLCTCNPDADSWVLQWVLPYLDEAGYPKEEMCGKQLYFLIEKDEPVFSEDPEELKAKYPELTQQLDPNTGEMIIVEPKSFVFIGGTINQ